jgi:hypothetical protein
LIFENEQLAIGNWQLAKPKTHAKMAFVAQTYAKL